MYLSHKPKIWSKIWSTVAATCALGACGTWQSTQEATANVTRSMFTTQVKQMNLVITSRAALNPDDSGKSLPVVVRVVQLKDAKAFETAAYAQLSDGPEVITSNREPLKADLLWSSETTLAPDTTLKLSETMNVATRYVGVVAFFRDVNHGEWQLVIPKSQWKKTNPVTLTVVNNKLEMAPSH
jgi:type VI secretion system protein VasD